MLILGPQASRPQRAPEGANRSLGAGNAKGIARHERAAHARRARRPRSL
jgi:hypothetical protein